VLRNLVDNAIKYTPVGGRVEMGGQAEQDSVLLRVKDTGIGIPEDQLPSIFDEFVQAHRNSANRRHGSGLGLTICRRIVRALGGRISVESTEGRGTAFAVHLPQWPQEEG
jgi:two-component system phosphate regulon sensor histidine kinase PhoR